MNTPQATLTDDAEELGESFFANAVVTEPGERVIDAAARARASTAQGDDWTVIEARKLAIVCRKHGLRCRVVRSKHRDSQLHIYREGDGFEQRLQAARADARERAIDAAWTVVTSSSKTD